MSNFVCMLGSLSTSVPVWVIMCVFACGWLGGRMCAYVSELKKKKKSLSRAQDYVGYWRRQVCSNETSTRTGIVWEDPHVFECVKSTDRSRHGRRKKRHVKKKRDDELTKYCRVLEIEETLKIQRAKEREINEREGGQLPVCVSASPRSDWELQATLSGLSLHTRCCHISLTGQQASLPLCPSLTSMWIITQCR